MVLSFIQYPFFLKKTEITKGTIIEFKEDYAFKYDLKRPIPSWKYKYIFIADNKYLTDWSARRRKKEMYLGKEIEVKYSLKNPLINEVEKFYSNKQNYKMFEREKLKGYEEIQFINGFYILKDYKKFEKLSKKEIGEYIITNDSVFVKNKPNTERFELRYILNYGKLLNIKNKKEYTEKTAGNNA